MALHTDMKNYLESCVSGLHLTEHPYFVMLRSGRMSKEQFLRTQMEFAPMSYFFSRPMAQIVANIPDTELRWAILENLDEEHGHGDINKAHGKTVVKLIERLGGPSNIDLNRPSFIGRRFNEVLRGACAFNDYRFAAAMYGAIEETFVDVSTMIYKAIVENGWLPENQIIHYGLHKEVDHEHAKGLLLAVNKDWENIDYQITIKEGIRFGCWLLTSIYTDFHRELVMADSDATAG